VDHAMSGTEHAQRIVRLTPLSEVLARIAARIGTVASRECDVSEALGRTLAQDVIVATNVPAAPMALRDGWAVQSDLTHDASSYTPAVLPALPKRLNAGDVLPAAADAVAPLDAVVIRAKTAEIVIAMAAGDGVLGAGADLSAKSILLVAGRRLKHGDIAALAAAGVRRIAVRAPRVRVAPPPGTGDAVIDAITSFAAAAIAHEGGVAIASDLPPDGDPLAAALQDDSVDAIVGIGGTGCGAADRSVETLAALGQVDAHGIAIMPGETAAVGFAGTRPVLLVPGRIDAAMAVWLLIGRHILAHLCGRELDEPAVTAELSRKISSPLGLAEMVPVRRLDQKVEPIASGYIPLQAIARADGWVLVPADSEGYQAGARVVVRPWP
jgi:molybdopterin biosynthesis enzyme